MGTKIKWAGDKDFGAFAFQADVTYDVDDLGDLPEGFVESAVLAGAAIVEGEAPKKVTRAKKEESGT